MPVLAVRLVPGASPHESYRFFTLPYCFRRASEQQQRQQQRSDDDGAEVSGIHLHFKRNETGRALCTWPAGDDAGARRAFARAVRRDMHFEMRIDGLPVYGRVGRHETSAGAVADQKDEKRGDGGGGDGISVYTAFRFRIAYNDEAQIVGASVHSANPVRLPSEASSWSSPAALTFTYDVAWTHSDRAYCDRHSDTLARAHAADAHDDDDDDEALYRNLFAIRWASMLNSLLIVALTGALAVAALARALRRDMARYTALAADDLDALESQCDDESGWKQVSGDVFRAPCRVSLLAMLYGVGAQMATLCLAVIVITSVGALYRARGAVGAVFRWAYAPTSAVAGYIGVGYYTRQLPPPPPPPSSSSSASSSSPPHTKSISPYWRARRRQRRVLLATMACAVPATLLLLHLVLNALAAERGAQPLVSTRLLLSTAAWWLAGAIPALLLGAACARRVRARARNPCKTNAVPRALPPRAARVMRYRAVLALAAGALPFISALLELHVLFISVWSTTMRSAYQVCGFLLLAYVNMLTISAAAGAVTTYVLLNAEAYAWQWPAFGCGASVGAYALVYVARFYRRSGMRGSLQLAAYGGYSVVLCAALSLICGAASFAGASVFARLIYSRSSS